MLLDLLKTKSGLLYTKIRVYIILEVISPTITIKVSGHQWYWSYEYSDYVTDSGDAIEFDSYMLPESDLELGQFRLLDVDNKVVVPTDTHIRLIVTSTDVIHSFAVPSLGLKLDCCPGRLNQASVLIDRQGTFYGQCSEICGLNALYYRILLYATKMTALSYW
jgi:cytochrome c oxidase subunit 2